MTFCVDHASGSTRIDSNWLAFPHKPFPLFVFPSLSKPYFWCLVIAVVSERVGSRGLDHELVPLHVFSVVLNHSIHLVINDHDRAAIWDGVPREVLS